MEKYQGIANNMLQQSSSFSAPATSKKEQKDLVAPSTPTAVRKLRRRSNLFPPFTNNKNKALEEKLKNGELGIGREIPVKQGFLYKKSQKALNKDWKKKWVTIKNGFLTYHSTLQDYQSEAQGKSIPLKHTTVKIPGQIPRGSKSIQGTSGPLSLIETTANGLKNDLSTAHFGSESFHEMLFPSTNPMFSNSKETSSNHHKKRRRHAKNSGYKNGDADEADSYEFIIVSLDNKQWHFEASSYEEREEWVTKIEEEILNSTATDSFKYRQKETTDRASVHSARELKWNSHCLDFTEQKCQKILQSNRNYAHNSSQSSTPCFGFGRHSSTNDLTKSDSFVSSSSVPDNQEIICMSYYENRDNSSLPYGLIPLKRIESKTPPVIKPSDRYQGIGNNMLQSSSFSAPATSKKDQKDLATPGSTPTTARKLRRRSNLFPPFTNNKNKALEEKLKNGELGIGREIPLKQGFLYKKSKKALNKDWKRKWVTIKDGFLTYHSTLQDYQSEAQGKSIPLKHTTVKVPGQKPRGSRPTQGSSGPSSLIETAASDLENDFNNLHLSSPANDTDKQVSGTVLPNIKESFNQKKRHRRVKNSNSKNSDGVDDSDGCEFIIVSLDNKQWHFEAPSCDEREEWVTKIEEEIFNSLQEMESDKSKYRISGITDRASVQTIREVTGNSNCADCNKSNPDWTSFNLGALICIECSGIHRNLGTHISRVRSLDLDDWPPGHVSVMKALGNAVTNSIYEFNILGRVKPNPTSTRDEKERWIRSKYDKKEFISPLDSSIPIEKQLMECVSNKDVPGVAKILAHISSPDQINSAAYSPDAKCPLHIAAATGSLAIAQLLIWYNTKVGAIDGDGKTALYYARINGHKDIEDLLIQHGCTSTTGTCTVTSFSSLRRRESITSTASLSLDMFDKLPASII